MLDRVLRPRSHGRSRPGPRPRTSPVARPGRGTDRSGSRTRTPTRARIRTRAGGTAPVPSEAFAPARVLAPALAVFLLLALPPAAPAQLIPLKTVPIATGNQFRIVPPANGGMAGVSIALDDPALDPFTNPARGAELPRRRVFGSPAFYSIGDDNGGGRTLPVGALADYGAVFGGLVGAFQQLRRPERWRGLAIVDGSTIVQNPALSGRTDNNVYTFGLLGATLPGTGISIGGSVLWAGLSAMDGVSMLYPRSRGIEQSGNLVDYRLGLARRWADARALELLLLHHRLDMTHEVAYIDGPVFGPTPDPVPTIRTETNLDRGRTWGAHLRYKQPVGSSGWRLGGILTTNWKSHPKIPNYELMAIPRDPGHSWAYNFGLGLARTVGPMRFGIDLVYEPIWSDTWAEAAEPVETASGDVIPTGGRTIENDFRFSNGRIRMGVSRETGRAGFQLGLRLRSIHYWLEQYDHVEEFKRDQEEAWLEWTPTWGASLEFSELEIRYTGGLQLGTGRPGVAPLWPAPGTVVSAGATASDMIVAPRGALTLQPASVLTSRVSVAVPMGGGPPVP